MNFSTDCKVYYSMIGEHFNIYERNTDKNVWAAQARVQVDVHQLELAPAGRFDDEAEAEFDSFTRLSIPGEIKGGPFFAADTQCIIVNGRNQILKLGGKYRFPIRMYRNLGQPDQFTIFFKEKEIKDIPHWISF